MKSRDETTGFRMFAEGLVTGGFHALILVLGPWALVWVALGISAYGFDPSSEFSIGGVRLDAPDRWLVVIFTFALAVAVVLAGLGLLMRAIREKLVERLTRREQSDY